MIFAGFGEEQHMSTEKDIDFVLRTVEKRDIRFVQLWFTDVLGNLKCFAISPEELEKLGAAGGDYNHGVYLKHPEWLEYMKQHGMISNIWTVNHPVDMIWAMRQQIDFLTTDRPDLFLQLQGK